MRERRIVRRGGRGLDRLEDNHSVDKDGISPRRRIGDGGTVSRMSGISLGQARGRCRGDILTILLFACLLLRSQTALFSLSFFGTATVFVD